MKSITQNKRYLPHEMSTKINSVKLYRQTGDVGFVVRRYHISKASLMRWNKQYDGTGESLLPKSHRPHSQHPNAHTEKIVLCGTICKGVPFQEALCQRLKMLCLPEALQQTRLLFLTPDPVLDAAGAAELAFQKQFGM